MSQRKQTSSQHNTACSGFTRRRVLQHVINGEHYAGAARVQDLLALALPDYGFDVGFECVKPDVFPRARRAQEVPLYRTVMRSKFD